MPTQPLINRRYQITALLGKGAMGQVYLATDEQTQQPVALKVIAQSLTLDADLVERFRREGEALRQLRHRNIVAFVEMFDYQGHQIIAMEYVSGGNLHALIQKGELPLPRIREIALDVCDALICAHRLNIIHRDIKPKNILLTDTGIPKLADFGVARLMEATTQLTSTSTMVGTPPYMSPEAWEGQPLDAQADVWSLGVMLFEMLTGEVPFRAETTASVMHKVLNARLPDLQALRPDTPPALVQIVERALTRDKTRRYASVRLMSVDIDQCLLPPTAPEISSPLPAEPLTPLQAEPLPSAVTLPPPAATAPPSIEPQREVAQPASVLAPAAPKVETPPPVITARRAAAWWESTSVLVGVSLLTLICLLIAGIWGWQTLGGMRLAPVATTTTAMVSLPASSSQTQAAPTLAPINTLTPPSLASAPTSAVTFTSAPVANTNTPAALTPAPSATPEPPAAVPTLGLGATQVYADGMVGVYVTAGTFLMGSTAADIAQAVPECPVGCIKDEQPQHTVILDAYWIDKTDITNAMFAKFVAATQYKTDAEKAGVSWVIDLAQRKQVEAAGADWRHPRDPAITNDGLDDYPVVQVSWNDAQAYCEWAGRQLPTEAQWEKAARGPLGGLGDGRQYPWGNAPVAGDRLNLADQSLNVPWAEPINDGFPFTSPVSQYPAGASPSGALDMVGNVSQWVADWYGQTYYAGSPDRNPTGPATGDKRVTRGSGWANLARLARVARRGSLEPDNRSGDLGFRCAH
jgi:eukaryotic-like serine/threonine-protein kinase